MRSLAIAGLSLALFGCDWAEPVSRDRTVTRAVDGSCPEVDAALEESHAIPLPTLCYYRVTGSADACNDGRETLEDVRELARSTSAPNPETGGVPRSYFYRCTADGLVFVQSVDSASCAFVDGVRWSFDPDPGLRATKLLATDARTPWTSCTYEIPGRRRDLADLGDR